MFSNNCFALLQVGQKNKEEGKKYYEKCLYFKLPLRDADYHWNFLDRKTLLSGDLTFKIKSDKRTINMNVFGNGELSKQWKPIGPAEGFENAIYFGFCSETKYPVKAKEKIEITLKVLKDIPGIGSDKKGILKAGTYIAKGELWVVHYEEEIDLSLYIKDYKKLKPAIDNNRNKFAYVYWYDEWDLKITENKGWMNNKKSSNRK